MISKLLAKCALYRLNLGGTSRWYLMGSRFFAEGLLRLEQDDATRRLEGVASSHFYLEPASRTLFKVVRDKYPRRQRPAKWLLRDILEKRLLGGSDAVKEWRSNRVLRRAGLATVACRGVGVALNLANPWGSVYAMPFLADAVSGEAHFLGLDEAGRLDFLRRLCDEVIALARHGYYHRDLHYGNLLVEGGERLVWIDTHIRRLPRRADRRRQRLLGMLSPTKLHGARYRDFAARYLSRHFDAQGQDAA